MGWHECQSKGPWFSKAIQEVERSAHLQSGRAVVADGVGGRLFVSYLPG